MRLATAALTLLLLASPCSAVRIDVACVGDSNTWGWGAPRQEQSYPAVLGQILAPHGDYRVWNYGAGGVGLLGWVGQNTEYSAYALLVGAINRLDEWIVLGFGTVDVAYNRDMNATFAAYHRRVNEVLTASPARNLIILPIPYEWNQAAADFNVRLRQEFTGYVLTLPPLIAGVDTYGNNVHLSASGYAKVAQAVADRILN